MHVAIIMNGNGRWAMKRGLPPTAGCIEGAPALRVLGSHLRTQARRCPEQAARISVIGNCKRPGAAVLQFHRDDESSNGMRSRLHLRIVIDYSEHDRLVQPTRSEVFRLQGAENFERRVRELDHTALPAGAVDLLVRTGGGKCRSDFGAS